MRATKLLGTFKKLKSASGGLFLFAGVTLAQEPEPILDRPASLGDPALPMTPAPALDSITLFPDAAEQMSLEKALDKNPWKFVLHGSAAATYNSNIFISNSNAQEDFIFTIAPGIAVGRGDFRRELLNLGSYENRFYPDRSEATEPVNYIFVHAIPSVTLFADHGSEDSFNPDVSLEGQYEWKRLTLGIKARYVTLNLPDVDLGQRVERSIFSGALTGKYDLSGKTSVELNFYNYIRDYSGDNVDSVEYRGQAWVNYQVRPKITLGLGLTYGRVTVSEGPDQSYEQVLLRGRYRATEKVAFDFTAGVEFREITGVTNPTNGVFSFGLTYAPFDGTSIYLQGFRRTVTSAGLPPSNYTVTGVEAQVRQRFLKRFYFVLAGGYQNADYEFFTTANTRNDNIFYIHPSIGMDITQWLSCEAGMTYRQNDSNTAKNSFSETTVYLQLNVFF